MKKYLLLIYLLILNFTYAQTFQKIYGSGNDDLVKSGQLTDDGNFILIGQSFDVNAGVLKCFIMKINLDGDTLWTRSIGEPGYDEFAFSIDQTMDGGYIILGARNIFANHNSKQQILVKTDSTGNTEWSRVFGVPGIVLPAFGLGSTVHQTNDSGYIVLAQLVDFTNTSDFGVLKLDSNGDTLWTKIFSSSQNADELPLGIIPTSDGGYIISQVTYIQSQLDVLNILKINSSGDIQWAKSFSDKIIINSICETSDGYLLGGSFYNQFIDVLLIKINFTGDTLWSRQYDGSSFDNGYSISLTNDGGCIIAGSTIRFGSGYYDALLIKTDSTGSLQWSKAYGHSTYAYETANIVKQLPDDGYLLGGRIDNGIFGMDDIYLIRTNSVGYSGCNDTNVAMIKSTPQFTISNPTFNYYSGIAVSNTTTTTKSGINYHTECSTIGIEEVFSGSLKISPNPAVEFIHIEAPGFASSGIVQIKNVFGECLITKRFDGNKVELNTQSLRAGIYFVNLYDGRKMFGGKIVVN